MKNKKQGCGLLYGGMPQLDEKILNQYQDGVVPSQRYATIKINGTMKFFKNLASARVDVVKNYTKRRKLEPK